MNNKKNIEIDISGKVYKIARVRGEYFDYVDDAQKVIDSLKRGRKADLFTYLKSPTTENLNATGFRSYDEIAVLPVSTLDNWWKKQIDAKTRNMARQAAKKGVEIKEVALDGELVKGIKLIYDEMPIRQGKPFWHYKKTLEELEAAHATFLEKSVFIGAFHNSGLIGFLKMVMLDETASIMQIISLISERNKSPNNALIAKAVEICAEQDKKYLQYASWSRRTLGKFKISNGFEQMRLPRVHVPLNTFGKVGLRCGALLKPEDIIPEKLMDALVDWRSTWYNRKYAGK